MVSQQAGSAAFESNIGGNYQEEVLDFKSNVKVFACALGTHPDTKGGKLHPSAHCRPSRTGMTDSTQHRWCTRLECYTSVAIDGLSRNLTS